MARRIRKQELLEAQNKQSGSTDENSRAPLSKLTSKQASSSTRQGKTLTGGLSGNCV